jgi:hypothetical protein
MDVAHDIAKQILELFLFPRDGRLSPAKL